MTGSTRLLRFQTPTQGKFLVTYTPAHIDHQEAKNTLIKALVRAQALNGPVSKYRTEIKHVIEGAHLTYRYILVTNLLAKAANKRVNALALQVGAELDGAFDSRSLCHKVFVPFERDHLAGKLGRSNEPYLNKPARHKALSLTNAVRKGYDTSILTTCINLLSSCTQAQAMDGLVDALYVTLQRELLVNSAARTDGDTSIHEALEIFAEKLLESSNEGENCALLAGMAFHFLTNMMAGIFDVRVHPVNQSGASSKEVLDIDVYLNKKLGFTAEIKDKNFTKEDVDHAANKVQLAGHDAMFFIKGPKASTSLTDQQIRKIGQEKGVRISVIPILVFYKTALGLCIDGVEALIAWEVVTRICDEARLKQTTTLAVKAVATEIGLI